MYIESCVPVQNPVRMLRAGAEFYDYLLGAVMLGGSSVGKSSVLVKYTEDLAPAHAPCITISATPKPVKQFNINNKKAALRLWDTPGKEMFSDIAEHHIRGCQGYVLVYSIVDVESFKRVKDWIVTIEKESGQSLTDFPAILIGNKCDREMDRQVSRESGKELAEKIGASFFESSAITGENLDQAFLSLVEQYIESKDLKKQLQHMKKKIKQLGESNDRAILTMSQLKREVRDKNKAAKGAYARAKGFEKKAKPLHQKINKDYDRVQKAVEKVAAAKHSAHSAEQKAQVLQTQVFSLQSRVQQVGERIAHLQVVKRGGGFRPTKSLNSVQQVWEVGKEAIELSDIVLGKGGWATVRVATFRGLNVAAKCLHNLIISEYNCRLFSREMSIAATVLHPNLVQFIGASLEGDPIILMELMSTSLRAELEKRSLSQDHITSISLDVARALLYLHSMQPDAIIHRDVSSANILLNPGPNNSLVAKVSDYGSANYLQQVATKGPGNPAYAAPEASSPAQQSTKMDVFSFGVLQLEMWTNQFPEQRMREALLQSLQRDNIKKLVQSCLRKDQLERPTMTDILKNLHQP